VEVVKEGVQVARISEPGAVFGELAALLDQPHTADVRALERSEFSVADAATLLASDPTAALYVAAILAGRLDAANGALIEVKHQLEAGTSRVAVARTVDKVAQLLGNVKVAAANAASSGDVEATARTKKAAPDTPPAMIRGRSGRPSFPMPPRFRRASRRCPSRRTSPERG
jgi:CRP-like cAMP-binding protein